MEDDESVKMATLKTAYAEIILNTSKEAAVRIMAADRKALCFQKDLFALKEDALRMLVHLKQMLDLKTAEAKVRSENQQKKIEELEAQLSEAEGIIVDLREELNLTQDKFEKIKCSQKQPLRRHTSDQFNNELIAKTDEGRCYKVQYPSTEDASTTKHSSEMPLHIQYAFRDQLITSAQEQPSILVHPSMLASLNTSVDVKSSKQRSSPCSSDSDEKDVKITSNVSAAKSLEHESSCGQALRDGFRRTRKNVKYQEAIASLRKSSRGRRAKSCQRPSFPKCGNYEGNQNAASIEVPNKNGMHSSPESYYEVNGIAPERSSEFPATSNFRETEGDAAEKESDVQTREESDGVSNKVLKFTFQRKRRREVLTKLDNNIKPEVNKVMRNGAKLQRSISKEEHSKDSQQLLQVARQLIKLSGNGH